MTASTRKRLLIACAVLILAIPAESVLLQALATPNQQDAVRAWVAGLDAHEVRAAAARIQQYPYAYRREIMRVLEPAERAVVWRNHIFVYIGSHPELDAADVAWLQAAMVAATAEAFATPSAASRATVAELGRQIQARLGRDATLELFHWLGPKDPALASLEPLSMRLSNWVRRQMVVSADTVSCDCNLEFGCTATGFHCAERTCTLDDEWPACGWWWNENCDGLCVVVPNPG